MMRRGWTALAVLLPAVLLAALIVQGVALLHEASDAQTIRDLAAGHDVAIATGSATPEVLLARIRFLLQRDRIEETVPLLDLLARRGVPPVLARAAYDVANARVRRAFAAIDQGDLDKAAAEIALARAGYKLTLRTTPADFDAKHNLDVASRLVRDFPKIAPDEDEEPAPRSSDLWTELPGQPRGLP